MQTKTYFANNVPAALEVARQELGPEALLMSSRPAPEHLRHFGRLEVAFAWDAPHRQDPVNEGPVNSESIPYGTERSRMRFSDLDEIRQQLTALRAAVSRPEKGSGEGRDDLQQNALAARLATAGLSPEFSREVARGALETAEPAGQVLDERMAVRQELARRLPTQQVGEVKSGETRVLALIGPPGRGKTTSLVKLAIRIGLARRFPVRIYSAGVHGVGGREQLARYAAILGVPQQSFESLEGLALAMNGDAWKGLILIDTPGVSPADRTELSEFTTFFAARPEIEKHLVLRADTRAADMLRVVARFAGLLPTRLLFTGLDEAGNLGAMVETMVQSGLPCGFAATGPRIPEDIQEMETDWLVRRFCQAMDAGSGAPPPVPLKARAAAAGA
jgi:flagellar biosynthesis protein FlhF